MVTNSFTSKLDLYKFLSSAVSYGNLGLFIGTGFSRAVLNDDKNQVALSWNELLEKVSDSLGIDYTAIQKAGVGFPEIASRICAAYSVKTGRSYRQALSEMKQKVASLTSWYPSLDRRSEFEGYLNSLSPSWIITTNYDLVIESILTGASIPLGPNNQLTSPREIIPVYHLHGIRTNPEEIVISQEDYISLFRPNEYRQLKLALTLTESTVLFIGYGLGDVNILTALDWSKNVFNRESVEFPQDVIQILHKSNPRETPYRDRNGILIIETDELSKFFKEFSEIRKEESKKEFEFNIKKFDIIKTLKAPSQDTVNQFIDNNDFRKSIINLLATTPSHLASGFISFLDKCITETWKRSFAPLAFEGYNQNLILLLDILSGFSAKNIPPTLFSTAAYGLDQVGYFVGTKKGESWAAAKTWDQRKGELSADMIKELNDVANQYSYINLKRLLDSIEN